MKQTNLVLDTRFRAALDRMAERGRLATYSAPVDPHLEVAGLMKQLDGGPALLFTTVDGYDMPVIGNLLSCQDNVEAAFGIDFRGVRDFVSRAIGDPKPPVLVERAPASSTSTPRTSTSGACCRCCFTPRPTAAATSPPAS